MSMSRIGRISPALGHNSRNRPPVVFAITFDMDRTASRTDHIGQALAEHGFTRQQGSVYCGDDSVDPVRCVLAVQALARTHVWFRPSVRDIRMLRIEDNNDLMPALLGA
jgi:virulence-associated protein VapD